MITLDNYAKQSLVSFQQSKEDDFETVDEVNKRIMENLKVKPNLELKKNPSEEETVPEPTTAQGTFSNFGTSMKKIWISFIDYIFVKFNFKFKGITKIHSNIRNYSFWNLGENVSYTHIRRIQLRSRIRKDEI